MGDVNHEPSMEEILASIKKIIAEDDRPHEDVPAVATVETPEGSAELDETVEVLELTDTVEAPGEVDADAALLAEEASTSVRSALATLAAISAEPSREDEAAGSEALENVVRDMLRPMLKQWLDDNLPAITERMVAREISRITRSGD